MFIVHFHCFLHHFLPLCGLDIRVHAVQINMWHCVYLTLLHNYLDDGGRDILQNLRSFYLVVILHISCGDLSILIQPLEAEPLFLVQLDAGVSIGPTAL